VSDVALQAATIDVPFWHTEHGVQLPALTVLV
jgi:hypothetical protein